MTDKVRIEVSRDIALQMAGWIQAHRPQGEWDPPFLPRFLDAIKDAVDVHV